MEAHYHKDAAAFRGNDWSQVNLLKLMLPGLLNTQKLEKLELM